MPYTLSQRKNLSARVLADKDFRDRFLTDPQKAAWTLGIFLSGPEAEQVKVAGAEIKALGAQLDSLLWKRGPSELEPTFIPFITIGDGGDDVIEG